jgi:hypothetical protein
MDTIQGKIDIVEKIRKFHDVASSSGVVLGLSSSGSIRGTDMGLSGGDSMVGTTKGVVGAVMGVEKGVTRVDKGVMGVDNTMVLAAGMSEFERGSIIVKVNIGGGITSKDDMRDSRGTVKGKKFNDINVSPPLNPYLKII